jgi:hypothetical protein
MLNTMAGSKLSSVNRGIQNIEKKGSSACLYTEKYAEVLSQSYGIALFFEENPFNNLPNWGQQNNPRQVGRSE